MGKEKSCYKWIIAGLMFLLIFTGLGFCSSNKSLYLSPITEALGFKRSTFSVGDSLRYIFTIIANTFFGVMMMKFGMKKLIIAGILCLLCSCGIYATADKLGYFYIAGALLGIGFSWTSTTMVGCVVNRWFTENKGTVIGTVLSANGIGAAVAAQWLMPYIYEEGNPFGYRNAYLMTAGVLVAVLVLVVIFFKDKSLPASASSEKNKKSNAWEGMETQDALKSSYFYIVAISMFCTGMILQGAEGMVAAFLKDRGFATAFIATVISIRSIVLSGTKLISGYFYDKFGIRVSSLICYISAILSMLLMIVIRHNGVGTVLAVAFAVVFAMALPLDTVMIPIFTSDLFGSKSYEKLLPILVSASTAGCAVGVPLWNLVYDITGSYTPAAITFGILLVVVLIAFQMIINKSEKLKKPL